jgi:hypothetical protein
MTIESTTGRDGFSFQVFKGGVDSPRTMGLRFPPTPPMKTSLKENKGEIKTLSQMFRGAKEKWTPDQINDFNCKAVLPHGKKYFFELLDNSYKKTDQFGEGFEWLAEVGRNKEGLYVKVTRWHRGYLADPGIYIFIEHFNLSREIFCVHEPAD